MHLLFFPIKDNQKDILAAKHAKLHGFLDDVLLSLAEGNVALCLAANFFQALSSLQTHLNLFY